MLLTPLPDADRQRLLQQLQTFARDAENLGNRLDSLPPFQTYYAYLGWVNTSMRMMRGL